jgi:hypothetical protein
MIRPTRTLTLHFRRDADDADGEDSLRGQLSAVTRVGRDLWLAGDESNAVERLSPTDDGHYGEHRSFALAELLDLPGGAEAEIDIEGLDHEGEWLWIVGSHGLARRKPKPEKKAAKQIERLAEIRSDGNRYLLARVPIVHDAEGRSALAREAGEGDERRTAARLTGGDRGNVLMDALRLDEHLAPFLAIPSKDNGFDVEGLAVRGDRVFLGLRGPVLRGWAVVLELRLRESAPGLLALDPIGDGGHPYRKHFLDLRGLGVRDLATRGDDLLVLAGPTMELDGPAGVYRWRHAFDADEHSLVGRDELPEILAVPYGVGEHDAHDHPEGCTLLSDEELLVVYDSPERERVVGESSVVADVFGIG